MHMDAINAYAHAGQQQTLRQPTSCQDARSARFTLAGKHRPTQKGKHTRNTSDPGQAGARRSERQPLRVSPCHHPSSGRALPCSARGLEGCACISEPVCWFSAVPGGWIGCVLRAHASVLCTTIACYLSIGTMV